MVKATKRVVIVGAGPGGLAAALLLAKAGAQVTVIEKGAKVGGRTSTIEQDGFRFDVGPTFFLYPQVLKEIFAAAGFDLDKELPMYRLDPQYRLVFGAGGELLATPDVTRMKAAIAAISPEDAHRFDAFLKHNRTKLSSFLPFLQSPFTSWRDLTKPQMMKLLPLLAPWRSLDSDLQVHFKDERIRLGFSFQSKYLGMSPFRCPSLFSILSFLEYEHGVFHPAGGCGSVTEVMAKLARSIGVDILLNEPVEKIETAEGVATGVRTSRRSLKADAVVMNADFANAVRKLLPGTSRKRWTDTRVAKSKYSCSTFMLYLGIEGRFDDVSHHTIYLAKDYRRNLHDIERDHRISDDPSFYVQNACVTDPTLAPTGHSTLYVLVPVTHDTGSIDWQAETPRLRALALEQIRKVGLHDVESRIRTERVISPSDWSTQYDLHLGATFSMAHSLDQMLHLRPHNRFDDVERMYLVGGGTHPGSGLPVIFESARITSKLLLEDLNMDSAWETASTAIVREPEFEVAS